MLWLLVYSTNIQREKKNTVFKKSKELFIFSQNNYGGHT